MKILLLGKNCQVGWELQRSLQPLGELIALDRNSSPLCGDLLQPAALAEAVRAVAPDVIVNAAAYTAVDKAESDKEYIHKINTDDLPSELKGKSKAEIAKIVDQKTKDRSTLQKEIAELAVKRQAFIDAEMKKRGGAESDDLGKAIESSIFDLAGKNGYKK